MADLTLMSLRAMLETAVSVGVGVTAVGSATAWLFRSKIKELLNGWLIRSLGGDPEKDESVREALDRRIDGRVQSTLDDLEDRMAEQEKASQLMAQVAHSIDENVRRLTVSIEKIGEAVVEQGKDIAKQGATVEMIAATMERRGGSR